MNDKVKTALAFVLFFASITVPMLIMAWVWYAYDVQTAIISALVGFGVLFLAGALLLWRVRDLSWLTISLPYLFSAAYSALPDVLPGPIDDSVVAALGALFSALLAARNNPQTPRWVFIVLLLAVIYNFFGFAIPGPVDEIIANFAALIIFLYGSRRVESPPQITISTK
ncbi:MAG: hypothetical protein OHK0052_06660 [Anaerolineales bacterium]